MTKTCFCLLLVIIFCCSHTQISLAGRPSLRKYAGEFMEIDVSARAQAMGGAFSAISDDAFAMFYNPAGLTQINSKQIGFTHTQQFISSINYDYIGFSNQLSNHRALGIALIRLGVDDIIDSRAAGKLDPVTGLPQGIDESKLKRYNASDYAFFFSFARRFNSRLSWGINVKLIRRNPDRNNSGNGIGVDAGILYTINQRWKISGTLRNATTTLISWDSGTKELVSPTLRIGSAYRIPIKNLSSHFVPVIDLIIQSHKQPILKKTSFNSGYIEGALGGELIVRKQLFLRAGYDQLERLNLGIGIKIPYINLDYSFTSYAKELGNAHRISLLINFAN